MILYSNIFLATSAKKGPNTSKVPFQAAHCHTINQIPIFEGKCHSNAVFKDNESWRKKNNVSTNITNAYHTTMSNLITYIFLSYYTLTFKRKSSDVNYDCIIALAHI